MPVSQSGQRCAHQSLARPENSPNATLRPAKGEQKSARLQREKSKQPTMYIRDPASEPTSSFPEPRDATDPDPGQNLSIRRDERGHLATNACLYIGIARSGLEKFDPTSILPWVSPRPSKPQPDGIGPALSNPHAQGGGHDLPDPAPAPRASGYGSSLAGQGLVSFARIELDCFELTTLFLAICMQRGRDDAKS